MQGDAVFERFKEITAETNSCMDKEPIAEHNLASLEQLAVPRHPDREFHNLNYETRDPISGAERSGGSGQWLGTAGGGGAGASL